MRYYRLLTILTDLSILLGVAAVATSENEAVYFVMALVGCAVAWRSDRAGRPAPTPIRAVLLAALLGYSLVDLLAFGEVITIALAHFVTFATLLKLTAIKGPRDYLQIYVMTLFMVVVGGYFSAHVVFGAILVLFLLVTAWAMMVLVMTQGAGLWVKSSPRDYAPRTLHRSRLPAVDQAVGVGTGRFMARTAAYVPALLVPAVLVFLLAPRGRAQRFGLGGVGGLQSVTGFSEQIQLGEMADILQSSATVMRIQLTDPISHRPLDAANVPLLWRGISLDEYAQHRTWQWRKTRSDQDRYILGQLLMAPDEFAVERLIRQHVMLEPIDSKVLFALGPVVRLTSANVGAISVYRDDGALVATDPPRRLREYVVYSARQPAPPRDPTRRPDDRYLEVPPEVRASLEAIAERIAPRQQYPTPLAQAQAMITYFHSGQLGYALSYRGTPGAEPVTDFLTKTREGHCELFASAMALLLRTRGIHSRVVNGFRGGEWNPLGQWLTIRQRDAHSWVEAYLPGQGWRPFDPTPGAEVAGPGARRSLGDLVAQTYDFLKWSWLEHVMRYDRQQQREVFRFAGDLAAAVGTTVSWNRLTLRQAWHGWKASVSRLGRGVGLSGGTVEAFVAVVSVLAMVTVGALVVVAAWHRRRRVRRLVARTEFYQTLLRCLARLGFLRRPSQTPMEFAAAVALARPEYLTIVPWLTEQYYRVRFGGHAVSDALAMRIRAALESVASCPASRDDSRRPS